MDDKSKTMISMDKLKKLSEASELRSKIEDKIEDLNLIILSHMNEVNHFYNEIIEHKTRQKKLVEGSSIRRWALIIKDEKNKLNKKLDSLELTLQRRRLLQSEIS